MDSPLVLLFVLTFIYLFIGFGLFQYHRYLLKTKHLKLYSKHSLVLGIISNGLMFLIYETSNNVLLIALLILVLVVMMLENYHQSKMLFQSILMTIAQCFVLTIILFSGLIFYDSSLK